MIFHKGLIHQDGSFAGKRTTFASKFLDGAELFDPYFDQFKHDTTHFVDSAGRAFNDKSQFSKLGPIKMQQSIEMMHDLMEPT